MRAASCPYYGVGISNLSAAYRTGNWHIELLLTHCRTLFVNKAGLENAKSLLTSYKQEKIEKMNAELWDAKKIVDSTLHPGMLYERSFKDMR